MTYSPWRVLEQMDDVIVGFVAVPSGTSWWEPDERVVLVDPRLDRVGRRVALAHEIEHILAGDVACNYTRYDQWFDDRMERRAWIRAARKLVTIEDLARALQCHEGDDDKVAEQLDVDQLVLDIRRETLQPDERRRLRRLVAGDDDVYPRPVRWRCGLERTEESA